MQLAGKVALITGAASGIGLGIAERFAQEGAAIALVDRDRAKGEQTAADIQQRGCTAHFIHADLAYPDQIEQAVSAAAALRGQLDIVVNNAAVFLPKGIDQITTAEWDWLMAINLRAPFLIVQAALPFLKASRGNVLNISSTAAIRVFSPNIPYSVSKSGLITLTKGLAQELHPYRIRVNCICPGAVDTPALHTDIVARGRGESVADVLENLRAQGIMASPAQIAATALHLVSDEGSAITGSIVIVDSGAILR